MSVTSWQAPILFELNDLADEPKEKKATGDDPKVAKKSVPVKKAEQKKHKLKQKNNRQQPFVVDIAETQQEMDVVTEKVEIKAAVIEKDSSEKHPQSVAKEEKNQPQPYQVAPNMAEPAISAHVDFKIPTNPVLTATQKQVKQSLQAPKILPKWLLKTIKLPSDKHNTWFYSPWVWLLGGLLSLYVMLLVGDAVALLQQQFTQSVFLGSLFTVIIGSIVGAVFFLIWRTYQDILQLKTVEHLRTWGSKLYQHEGYGQALAYIKQINQLYLHREDNKKHIDRFYIAVDNCHSNHEVCLLYSQRVLQPIDQQAQAIVAKRAGETALMVVFSPFPFLSTILTLWRNLKMMRDIAHLYSGRPSFIASMSLSVMVIQNLIFAGVSEVIANSIARLFDKSISSILVGQMSQGIGSAIISARIGLKTIELCRPMPFADEEQPKLKNIAKEISDLLKSFVRKEK